jgi:hypothetical protein
MTPQKAKLSAGVVSVSTLPSGLTPDQQRTTPKLPEAINRMMSLHDGDRGLLEVVACGKEAIGPLRLLLFKREPSGIYEPRRRVASALRSLQAYDVLREFLALRREISDPVERTGEDAVINAVARELMCRPRETDFSLLLDVLRWRLLAGVIESAGAFEKPDAIPYFIDALAEDDCRPEAETALLRLGRLSESALVKCATRRPRSGFESSTSRRQRRSALELLTEIGIAPERWVRLRHLIDEPDPKFAAPVCKLALMTPRIGDQRNAMERLLDLLGGSDWMVANNIEAWLSEHFSELSSRVDDVLAKGEVSLSDRAKLALARVKTPAISARSKTTSEHAIENFQ